MSAFEQVQHKLRIKINSNNNIKLKGFTHMNTPSSNSNNNSLRSRALSTGNSPSSRPKFRSSTQTQTSSTPHSLLKPKSNDPSRRLSAYLMNITDPKHKAGRIKRMLRWNNMTEQDISMSLPSKYQDLYQIIKSKNAKNSINNHQRQNGGLQGDINIVKNRENERFIMKSMIYKTVYELKKYMERYLIVYNNKFMDYKDIFIDIDQKKMHIIQHFFILKFW